MNKYTLNIPHFKLVRQSIHLNNGIREEFHLRDEYSRLYMSSTLLKLIHSFHTYNHTRHTEPPDYRNIPGRKDNLYQSKLYFEFHSMPYKLFLLYHNFCKYNGREDILFGQERNSFHCINKP